VFFASVCTYCIVLLIVLLFSVFLQYFDTVGCVFRPVNLYILCWWRR